MHPIVWFIENPVKVCCGVILIVLFGLLAIFQMPIQLSPDEQQGKKVCHITDYKLITGGEVARTVSVHAASGHIS